MKQDLWNLQSQAGETNPLNTGMWGYQMGIWLTLALFSTYQGLIPLNLSVLKASVSEQYQPSEQNQALIVEQGGAAGINLPQLGPKITLP
jgi:hypothetical protein